MKLLELWDHPEVVTGYSGRPYYKLATVTWSPPKLWSPSEPEFPVPSGWEDRGGVYVFLRKHWRQNGGPRLAYIGKANNFPNRLTSGHHRFDVVRRRGDTLVSCGRIDFGRVRAHPGYYAQIEDILRLAVHHYSENRQGFESLPGFRASQPTSMLPWVITNEGHRFGRLLPKRVVCPSVGVEH